MRARKTLRLLFGFILLSMIVVTAWASWRQPVWQWGGLTQPLSVSKAYKLLETGVLNAIHVLWHAIVHAALGWIVVGPALIYVLYKLFTPLLVYAAQMRATATARAGGPQL